MGREDPIEFYIIFIKKIKLVFINNKNLYLVGRMVKLFKL